MERSLILVQLLFVFAVGIPSTRRQECVNPVIKNAVMGLSNQLAVNIHQRLAAKDGNVFFSPLSISTALAMLFYGARGQTAAEMRHVLGYSKGILTDSDVHASFQSLLQTFSENSSEDYVIHIANAVLTKKRYPIRTKYQEWLQKFYNAIARDVDFVNEGQKVLQEINDWVKLKTNNQIDKLLDKVDPATVMILLNAVSFKGTWKTQFDPKNTKNGTFFNRGLRTHQTTVPMMHLVATLPYDRVGGLHVLELPYKGEDISMVIVLPVVTTGLSNLEHKLEPNMLRHLRWRTTTTGKTKVHVRLPKFKLEYESILNTVLRDLGLKNTFSSMAELGGISETGRITLSKVVHKAVVEVNEEGSEASAITGGIIANMIPGLPESYFVADHPFLFAIVDRRSDLILFQGRVNEL